MAFDMSTNSTERKVRVVEEPPQLNVEPRARSTSDLVGTTSEGTRRYE